MGRSTKLTCFVPLNNVLTLSIVLLHKSKCARAYSFCAQAHLNVPKHNTTIDREGLAIRIFIHPISQPLERTLFVSVHALRHCDAVMNKLLPRITDIPTHSLIGVKHFIFHV
jgi:hypothetical protein